MLLRRTSVAAGVALVLASTLAGCGSDGSGAGKDGDLTVVTSFYPLQFVAERVVGDEHRDRVHISDLAQPGQEPHDLELDFKRTAELTEADVVFYEHGLQPAVDDAIKTNEPAHVVDAGRSADLRDFAANSGETGTDPHFWLDPTRLAKVATAFERTLAGVDPDHAADYRRNLSVLLGQLRSLDVRFRTGLADCRIKTLVASHDAFGYLGRRYGLQVDGINGLSPDAEPSPARIRRLQDLIESDGLTTVYSEPLVSSKLADSLAEDLGLRTATLDPIEGLSKATADESYLSLMRENLSALEKGNQCTEAG